jgi:hypothetical protein
MAPIPDPILAGLLADIETAQERLRLYLAECGRLPSAPNDAEAWPASASHPDLLPTRQAARRAGCSTDTIGRWCRQDGIGRMYGKRWRISVSRLQAKMRA